MRFFSLSLKNKILPEKNFESLLKKNFLFLKYWTGQKNSEIFFNCSLQKKNEKKFLCSKIWIFFSKKKFSEKEVRKWKMNEAVLFKSQQKFKSEFPSVQYPCSHYLQRFRNTGIHKKSQALWRDIGLNSFYKMQDSGRGSSNFSFFRIYKFS